MWVRSNLGSAHFVVALTIRAYLHIVRFPLVEVANQQMMVSATQFTQRNQVVRIKLQVGVQVERFDMMDLQAMPSMAAYNTRGFNCQVLVCHPRPFRAAFVPMLPGYMRSVVNPAVNLIERRPYAPLAVLAARRRSTARGRMAPASPDTNDLEKNNRHNDNADDYQERW